VWRGGRHINLATGPRNMAGRPLARCFVISDWLLLRQSSDRFEQTASAISLPDRETYFARSEAIEAVTTKERVSRVIARYTNIPGIPSKSSYHLAPEEVLPKRHQQHIGNPRKQKSSFLNLVHHKQNKQTNKLRGP
jgi:hypothetical protein